MIETQRVILEGEIFCVEGADSALRHDVVAAVENGKFAVYPVRTVDEGIELLTGVNAGVRDDAGAFPEGSVNRLVEDRLINFSLQLKHYAKSDKAEDDSKNSGD